MVLYDFVEMNYYLSECIQLEKEIKHTKRYSQDTSVGNHGNKLLYKIMQI